MTLILGCLLIGPGAALAWPPLRRIAAFVLQALRQALRLGADALGVRRLWAGASGRRHVPLPAPAVARAFCEAMGPTFVKLGQVVASSLPKIHEIAVLHRISLPREFLLITKQILYFDRYAKLLAPTLNIFRDPRLLVGMMGDIQKVRMEQGATAAPAPAGGARA